MHKKIFILLTIGVLERWLSKINKSIKVSFFSFLLFYCIRRLLFFFFYFTFPSFIIVFTSHLISWNKKTTSTKDCCASWPGLYSLLLSKNSIVKRYLATVAAYHCHCQQHSAVGASSPQFPLTHHTQWDKPPPGEEVATTKPPLPCGKDIHPTLPPSGEAFNFHSPSCCPIKQPHVSL